MDTQTGNIHNLTEEEARKILDNPYDSERSYSLERKMVSLSKDESKQCETMPNQQRKGWMRNKTCVCGSGKKFKNCCWSKFE